MRIHHRFVEARGGDVALEVHLHFAGEAHALDPGHQRADAVGQALGQHRHHEAREVHRGGALDGFVVQRRAGAHVVRHVGDGDDQAEAIGVGFAPDGVVEVLGVLAVNGDQRHLAQVHAVDDFRRGHVHRHQRGFGQRLAREHVRQVVAVDGGFHHQRRRQLVAQHQQDAADGRPAVLRRGRHFHHHQLPFAGLVAVFGWNQHFGQHAAVVGDHHADARAFAVAAGEAREAVLQHFDDGAFAAAAAVNAGDAGQHAVAVQRLAHFGRRQEQVFAAVLGLHEAEAVRVGDDGAGDQVELLGRGVAAAAVHQQLAVAHHGGQAARQGLEAVGRGEPQGPGDVLGGERAVAVADEVAEGFAAGDGLFVLARLAGGMRIGQPGAAVRTARGLAGAPGAGEGGLAAGLGACLAALFAAGLGAGLAGGLGFGFGLGGTGRRCRAGRACAFRHPRRQFAAGATLLGRLCHVRHGTPAAEPDRSKRSRALTRRSVAINLSGFLLHRTGSTCPGGGIGRRTSFRY